MKYILTFLLMSTATVPAAEMQTHRDLPYADSKNKRQTLDVYAPREGEDHPVIFWIHGGGWQRGDKSEVERKPQAFVEKGFVFVSANYRLLPEVTIKQMAEDTAKGIRWVRDHVREFGGDPSRIFVMGHSAGAQLAALICTDDRYLKAEGLSLSLIKGCVPVDGGTYDVPMQVKNVDERTADVFRRKFGDGAGQKDLSAVTHVAANKQIPPFLILFVAGHPRTSPQALRLEQVLAEAGVPAKAVPAEDRDHRSLNSQIGEPGDKSTRALFQFVDRALAVAKNSGLQSEMNWKTGPPLVLPQDVEGIACYSIKDPSVVRYKDRWHLFCTIRGKERSHAVVYLTFTDWRQADKAERHLLRMHAGYYCAPQVFYFRPQKRWYMICQAAGDEWEPNYQPAFATSKQIDDPDAWSKLKPLFEKKPANVRRWLDFWIICDDSKAHLFFTSLDGKLWRSETDLRSFPTGWSRPEIALQGDVFEASHIYRLKGRNQYLTLIEAQGGHGWRYYKSYLADRLEGPWKPLAATRDQAFASMRNVDHPSDRWTDSVSHGELLRSGFDERLEVDPDRLRFLYQGVRDDDRKGKPYGQIPWRLGLLEPGSP